MRTLSPETKITLKTACSVIGAGIIGVATVVSWLNGKFEVQANATAILQTNVVYIRRATDRCWTVDHQQVWTDLYNERNQAGKIPTPSEVAARVKTMPSPN